MGENGRKGAEGTEVAECEAVVLTSPFLQRTINRDLATINGKVNNMDVKKIRHKFRWFNCENQEDVEACRKAVKLRLAKIIRRHAASLYVNQRVLPYYVVLDFEATCEALNPPDYKHEIIEFPAILVNASTLQIQDTFRRICRPTVNSRLSEFCKTLTGITQQQVDLAEPFSVALDSFNSWLQSHRLGTDHPFAVVTDGPWDCSRFLYTQCLLSNVEYPTWAEQWIDLRKVFGKFYQQKRTSLAAMLDHLGMAFEGRPHCGADDAHNIARVLLQLMCDGAALEPNEALTTRGGNISPEHLTHETLTTRGGNISPEHLTHETLTTRGDNVNPEQLALQLSQIVIQANRVAIPPKEKLPVHRDVKKERSKKIDALTRSLGGEEGLTEEGEASGDSEEWKTQAAPRRTRPSTKKAKAKPKKRFH